MNVLVFFPKGHFNVYDRVGRGIGTTLYSFKETKSATMNIFRKFLFSF